MESQIVAIGGGAFSDGSPNLDLENFIQMCALYEELRELSQQRSDGEK
jgi:hypothetical protein